MSHRTIRPLFDKLVVLDFEGQRQTASGLILPEPNRPDVVEGFVVAVGPKVDQLEDVAPKDNILYADTEGKLVDLDGTVHRFLSLGDVMAILTEEDREKPWSERLPIVLGNWILFEWELAKDTLLDGKLLKSEKHKKMHYTGIVLDKGPGAGDEVQVGKRYMFDHFSDFKPWYEGGKRFAFVKNTEGVNVHAEIPPRTVDGEKAKTDVELTDDELVGMTE